jgi:hypothetical protein
VGSQVNFFMSPEDEETFCRFVVADPDVTILYAMQVDRPIVPAEFPYPPTLDEFYGGFALWNRSVASEELITPKRKVKNVDAPDGVYLIHAFVYPVIEMIRSGSTADLISPGRIWARFDHKGLNDDQQRRMKNWFRRLANWLNKLPYRCFEYRVGSGAKEFFDRGGKAIGFGMEPIASLIEKYDRTKKKRTGRRS